MQVQSIRLCQPVISWPTGATPSACSRGAAIGRQTLLGWLARPCSSAPLPVCSDAARNGGAGSARSGRFVVHPGFGVPSVAVAGSLAGWGRGSTGNACAGPAEPAWLPVARLTQRGRLWFGRRFARAAADSHVPGPRDGLTGVCGLPPVWRVEGGWTCDGHPFRTKAEATRFARQLRDWRARATTQVRAQANDVLGVWASKIMLPGVVCGTTFWPVVLFLLRVAMEVKQDWSGGHHLRAWARVWRLMRRSEAVRVWCSWELRDARSLASLRRIQCLGGRAATARRWAVAKADGGWRPITALPAYLRALDTWPAMFIAAWLEVHRPRTPQMGYRWGRSVASAVARLLAYPRQHGLVLVQADIAKAFDSVNVDMLLARLARMGVPAGLRSWWRWACNPRVVVAPQDVERLSATGALTTQVAGVPQGLPSSAFLLSLYTGAVTWKTAMAYADNLYAWVKQSQYAATVARWTAELLPLGMKLKPSSIVHTAPGGKVRVLGHEVLVARDPLCHAASIAPMGKRGGRSVRPCTGDHAAAWRIPFRRLRWSG